MGVVLVTNKREIKVDGPLAWSGVSTEKYQQLLSNKDYDVIDVVAIFCGIDHDLLFQCKDQGKIGVLYSMVAFAFDTDIDDTLPDYFVYDGQAYKMPKVRNMSFGQMVLLRKHMEKKSLNEGVSLACAIYLQPLIDGGAFDLERALEIEKEIAKMPITKTYGLGFFFLRKLRSNGNIFMNLWNLLRYLPIRRM